MCSIIIVMGANRTKMSTDKELLDFLEELNNENKYTGYCILRMSGTGRGWRLHETSLDDDGAVSSVREAIELFQETRKNERT